VREWHRQIMEGLDVPDAAYVGRFRGEPGVHVDVSIGAADGVAYREVKTQLEDFEKRLQSIVAALDDQHPPSARLDPDTIAAVADLAGWAHA